MNESHDREIIGGHLLVIGGAEDKYNERRILKRFLELAGGEKAEVSSFRWPRIILNSRRMFIRRRFGIWG